MSRNFLRGGSNFFYGQKNPNKLKKFSKDLGILTPKTPPLDTPLIEGIVPLFGEKKLW